MATVIPTKSMVVDDKYGYHYIIMDIQHVEGADSIVVVPDSAISAAQLPTTRNAATQIALIAGSDTGAINPSDNEMALENLTSGTSGLGFTFQAGDGVKQLIIDTAVASGIYKIVVLCVGSPAGTGSTKEANL